MGKNPPAWENVVVPYCPNCRRKCPGNSERCPRCGGPVVEQVRRRPLPDR